MLYEFKVYQMEVEDHIFWVAESLSLKGCVGQGETSEEAIKELEENEKEWLDTAKEFGISIPPRAVKKPKTYSGKISLRVSSFVHQEAHEIASAIGVSVNQLINDALIDYMQKVKHSQNNVLLDDSFTEETTKFIKFTPKDSIAPIVNNVSRELEEM